MTQLLTINERSKRCLGDIDLGEFIYNVYGYQFYHIKTPQLRRQLTRVSKWCEELKVTDVMRAVETRGLIIMAEGSDGSNSSWVIAVDPRIKEQVLFLAAWCGSLRFVRHVLRDPSEFVRRVMYSDLPQPVREGLLRAYGTVMEVYGRCLREGVDAESCINNAALTIIYRDWAFALSNSKVRLVREPCEVLRNAGGE